MKALTLWQPWASLVVAGAKPYEFRSWQPPIRMVRERIVIHASARKVDYREVNSMVTALEVCDDHGDSLCLYREPALALLRSWLDDQGEPALPLGVGVGTAVIGVPRSGSEIAEELGIALANDSDRDEHCNWGWPMRDVEMWGLPVPMAGKQGLWTWPEATGGGSCRVDSCSLDAKPGQLMCRAHWFTVPKPIRDAIWETYGTDKRAYITNVHAALDAIGVRK